MVGAAQFRSRGSEHTLEVDTVIYALGTRPNPIIQQSLPELELTPRGTIKVDDSTAMTSVPGVFAGGDVTTGSATVILAMGAGRRAAQGMLQYMDSAGEQLRWQHCVPNVGAPWRKIRCAALRSSTLGAAIAAAS